MAVAVSLLIGTVLVSAPAVAAASGGYAVTELPVSQGAGSLAADPATNTVYVAATSGPAVTAINTATNAATAQIPLPESPSALTIDPTSDTVYAIGTTSLPSPENPDAVYVISAATKAVTSTIPLPSSFHGGVAAVDAVTDMVYVTDNQDATVIVINGRTNTVTATIPLSDPVLDPAPTPQYVAVDTATNTIYVSDDPLSSQSSDQIDVIDGATNTVTGRIALPSSGAGQMTIDPAVGLLYVAESGSIAVINTATMSVSSLTNATTEPAGLALDPATGTLFATAVSGGSDGLGLGTTWVIDTATGSIQASIPRGGESIALPTSGGSLYVGGSTTAGWLNQDVTVITPSTVSTMSPVILNTALVCTVGQTCQVQLTSSAIPPATFSGPGLPAWLTVSPSGLLAGTPPAGTGGAYTVPVTAANGFAPSDTAALPVSVDEAPTITSANQVTFYAGAANSFTMTASGYPAATFFETGALPAGVTLSSSGVLSGTPTTSGVGSYPIVVQAFNDVNPGTKVTQAFTLNVAAPPPSAAAVGVEGTDRQLWIQAPQLGAGWHPLGGVITGAPAVAAPPNADGAALAQPLFIATGTDKHLYVRSLTAGWQQLDAATASCVGGPAAVITGTAAPGYTLTAACRGTDNALWYDTAPWSGTGLPALSPAGWKSLGGVLSAGPAAAPVGTTVTFFVRGSNGAIFTRTAAAGYSQTPWACIGAPAAAQQAADGVTTFACQGTDHALWEAASAGSGWNPAVSLGGALIGGPAVAATSQQIQFFVEATNQTVFQRTVAGWYSLAGGAVGGVGATALN